MKEISEYDLKQLPAGTVFMIIRPNSYFNSVGIKTEAVLGNPIYIKSEDAVNYSQHFKAKYLFQAPNTSEIDIIVNSKKKFYLLEPEDLEQIIRLAQESLDNYSVVMQKVESMKYRLLVDVQADLLTTPLFYDFTVMSASDIDLHKALSKVTHPIRVTRVLYRSDGRHNIELEGGIRKNNIDLARLLIERLY